MKLHYQISGSGEPLIILHGLFGTLENWGAQTAAFNDHYQVISVDLRNHGRSPHSSEMTYPAMAEDIQSLMQSLNLKNALFLGHSMGGKVAMQVALSYPSLIRKLVIADIAPVEYIPHHDEIFHGLFEIPLEQLGSRKEADDILKPHIVEQSTRAFLLKNLYRDENKNFSWRPNLQALKQQYHQISKAPTGTPFQGETLFLKGMNSNYIQEHHVEPIKQLFPQSRFKAIEGAGHWLHAEKPKIFSQIVLKFLAREDK